MHIRCAVCGQELECNEVAEDGQSVVCPCCGKSFVYSKPKLGVRRPAQMTQTSDGASRLVNQVEARANAERRRARLKRIKAFFNNVFALILLAGIGFGGYKAYEHFYGSEAESKEESLIARVESAAKREEETLRAELARRKELTEKRQREMEEAKKKEKTRLFYETRESFAGARLGYWSELAKGRRPGASEGDFGLVVPVERGKCEYYKVSSRKGGVTVLRLSDTTEPQEISPSDYEQMMKSRGGFFLKEGVAYFVSPSGSKKSWPAPRGKGATFRPAQCVFGEAYAILEDRLFETGERCFDVYLSSDGAAGPVKVDTVRFDETVDYAAFARAASDLLLEIRSRRSRRRKSSERSSSTTARASRGAWAA